ncbi:hypothetical protein [uncultured Sunxiuqinia sp.]|uniref:hypothetical protein n=1 Tax=uncultured Sunxiuqinia sp. TaxID=1573825 RepID=UPI002603BB58|nr:hypothetical protein [uncultured Sunxiuqinia sp.]
MMSQSYLNYIPAFLLTVLSCNLATAQQDTTLTQEVEVVKAYQPSVSDVFKINDIPKVQDEKRDKPVFNYQINAQPVFSTFEVEPVPAAEMVGEPQAELGKGLLKAGFGNYMTPYGELFFNTQAGKNAILGMHFKHLSSHGSVKLENDDKVDAPHSENGVELFTKHFFKRSSLNTKLFFNRHAHRYYGYTGEALPDADKELLFPYWNEDQAFSKGGIQLNLNNDEDSRADMNYGVDLYFHHFGTKTDQTENYIKLGTSRQKDYDSYQGLLDASVSFLKTDGVIKEITEDYGDKQQIRIDLSPAFLLQADLAKLQLGLNAFTLLDDDDDARILVTPNIKADWSPIENTMTLFAAIDGRLEQNHYSVIAAENRFVTPTQDIRNTEYRYILSGGIKGKFTPKLNYRFQAEYANIKDEHFYLINTKTIIPPVSPVIDLPTVTRSNTFDVLYDDLKQVTLGAEFYYTASELVNFHLQANYFSYTLDSLEEAYNKPDFELTLSTIINPEGPLKFNADIFFKGERKALEQNELYFPMESTVGPQEVNRTIHTLGSYVDLNVGVEYQYSPNLSFWGRMNNVAFQKYENWLGYSQQGLNLLIGASFSF